MNTASFINKLKPRNPAMSAIIGYGIAVLLIYALLGMLALKVSVDFPFGPLILLLSASFPLGLLHYWSMERLDTAANMPLSPVWLTLVLAALSMTVLAVIFYGNNQLFHLAVTPAYAMLAFFIGKALQEWRKIPAYSPPVVVLDNYTAVTGLKVFGETRQFVQFVFKTKEGDSCSAELPPSLGYSIDPATAFDIPLEQLFSAFLLFNNFNENSTCQIRVEYPVHDDSLVPFGWAFYTKRWPGWGRRYLDPAVSLNRNRVLAHPSLWRSNGIVRLVHKVTIQVIRKRASRQ